MKVKLWSESVGDLGERRLVAGTRAPQQLLLA